ncbi:MAG: hypothetical protein H6907_10000 [Hyphomicrobiales bacterium]|nr:hypothetical protein [Hyphomicrobiales bacterium]MCP5372051.1 hypothetical protein [Hyphomicrobiales bacterium]
MTTTTQNPETRSDNGNQPDWVAKSPRGTGRNQRLERIGVAWTRDDGGLCLRLVGTQIVDEDIYLYPLNGDPGTEA